MLEMIPTTSLYQGRGNENVLKGVGEEVARVNKLGLLAPWLVLVLTLTIGYIGFAAHRHKES
jgi:hypothetical protein